MPYEIRKDGDKFCVVKKIGGSVVKCHDDEESAKKHLAALNINIESSIVFEQVNAPLHIEIQASDEGDILVFKNAILARAEVNGNRDEITKEGILELAASIAGRALDLEHRPKEIVGMFTAGRVADENALSVDGLIWADRWPLVSSGVQDGAYHLSVEADAQSATCSTCGGTFASSAEYCEHLISRKGSSAVRRVSGLKAKGGAVTKRPAASNPRFDQSSIYFVASHGEGGKQETSIDVIAAELDVCGTDLADWLIDVHAKQLTYEQREKLDDKDFAIIKDGQRRFPINDCAHAQNALSRLSQAKDLSDAERATVKRKAESKLASKECKSNVGGNMDLEQLKAQLEAMTKELESVKASLVAMTAERDKLTASSLEAAERAAAEVTEVRSRYHQAVLASSFDEAKVKELLPRIAGMTDDQVTLFASTVREAKPKQQAPGAAVSLPDGDTGKKKIGW